MSGVAQYGRLTRRTSNKGRLSMTLDQYLKLLDRTGRQIRKDKVGVIPQECVPILERLDCSARRGSAESFREFPMNRSESRLSVKAST